MVAVVVVMKTTLMVMSHCITLLQNIFYYCWRVESWVGLIIVLIQSLFLT